MWENPKQVIKIQKMNLTVLQMDNRITLKGDRKENKAPW